MQEETRKDVERAFGVLQAQTHDFETPKEQVEIPEDQDAAQLMNFLQMH